jgi:arylsulfatase A-like enzyme
VEAVAQNIDIMPTVLELLDVDVSGLELQGSSLLPVIEGGAAVNSVAFSLQYPFCSADDGRFKLIASLDDGTRLLFDLSQDAGERHDLAPTDADLVSRLQGQLRPWIASEVMTEGGQRGLDSLEGSRELLKALGYLE